MWAVHSHTCESISHSPYPFTLLLPLTPTTSDIFLCYFFFLCLHFICLSALLRFFFSLWHPSTINFLPLLCPLLPQNRTSSPPTILATSPTSSSEKTRWSTTAAVRCFPVPAAFARMTLVVVFSWRTPGPPSWRLGWTAPDLEKSPLTTTSSREHFTCQSWSCFTASLRPTCE